MRFCECYRELMEGTVKPSDGNFRVLEELFEHPVTQQYKRWHNLTYEEVLFNVSPEKWEEVTGLSEAERDALVMAVCKETYPVSLFIESYGWLILLSPGTLRNFLSSRFKLYADRKLAIVEQSAEKRRQRPKPAKVKPPRTTFTQLLRG